MILLILFGALPGSRENVEGAYSTTSTDVNGNHHLGSNVVNDSYFYDTTKDSSPDTLQKLGTDPNWQNGVVRKDYALSFNGTSQYVSVAGASSLNNAAWTFEAWIYWKGSDGGSYGGLVEDVNGNTGTNADRILINDSTSKIIVQDDSGTVLTAATALTTSTWYHIAVTQTGGVPKLYINGALDATGSAGTFTPGTGAVTIGRGSANSNTYFFNGVMDEIRLSKTVRYTAAFAPSRRYTEDVNTVGLWHLDDGTGNTATDSSQSSNDGDLTGHAPTWVTGDQAIMDGFAGQSPDGSITAQNQKGGQTGAGNLSVTSKSSATSRKSYDVQITGAPGLWLDGSNDLVATSNVSGVAGAGSLTVEGWFKQDALATNKALITKWDYQTQGEFSIQTDSSDNTKLVVVIATSVGDAGTTYATTATGAWSAGVWHHVAFVHRSNPLGSNASRLKLFIDGNLQSLTFTGTIPDSLTSATSVVRFGSYGGTRTYPWNGYVNEVRISNSLRYAANFTPARRFVIDTSTLGLWHCNDGTGTTVSEVINSSNNGSLLNGLSNSPAADGTTYGPIWKEGLPASADLVLGGNSTSTGASAWALPGYQFRQQIKVTNNDGSNALDAGTGVDDTTDVRNTALNNHQTRADGKDWRIVYQPNPVTPYLVFNGSSNFVSVNGHKGLEYQDSNQFTVDAWINWVGLGANTQYIWDNRNRSSGSSEPYYAVYVDKTNNKIVASGMNNASGETTASVTIANGAWLHIAAVFDKTNSKIRIYVNGVLGQETSWTAYAGATQSSGLKTIGDAYTSGSEFWGDIGEFRISNTVRYNSNFQPPASPYVPDSNTKALYYMDQQSGQFIYDSSGNENNATLGADAGSNTDDPSWAIDSTGANMTREIPHYFPHGHAVGFDGSATYIRNSSAVISSGPFTVDFWFKNTDFAATYTLASLGPTSGSNIAVQTTTGSHLQIMVDGSTTAAGATTLSANTWYHVALTYDPGRTPNKTIAYLNGNKEISQNVSAAFSVANFTAGASTKTSPDTFYKGQLDEFRISSSDRFRENFTVNSVPDVKDSNTVLLWHLDDGSGTSAADNAGSYTGTITSGTWVTNGGYVDSVVETGFKLVAPIAASGTDSNYYLYYGNPGEQGSPQTYSSNALKLNGTNTYVSISANISNTFTTSMWIYPTNAYASSYGALIAQSNSLGIFWHNSHIDYYYSGDHNNTSSISLNTWHHIVIVNNGGSVTFYTDGAADGTSSSASAINAAYIGSDNANEAFPGRIDDVRLYTRAISSAEVTELYSNVAAIDNTNLLRWYKFDDSLAAGTTAVDSSGNASNGTLTNFTFDQNSNWVPNFSLKHASSEPTTTDAVSGGEQESPRFIQWRQAGGTWSSWMQMPYTETQLGSEGVYIKFNPEGAYSRRDSFSIESWAPEAFSTSSPARGTKRGFPTHANIMATNAGLDIVDADTNQLWMRFDDGTNNMIGSSGTAIKAVKALNGRIYVASTDGMTEVRFDRDNAQRYLEGTLATGMNKYQKSLAERLGFIQKAEAAGSGSIGGTSGNTTYAGNISQRNAGSNYGTISGTGIGSGTAVNDVSVAVIGSPPLTYAAVATNSDVIMLADITRAGDSGTTLKSGYKYAKTDGDNYNKVILTSGGTLYASDTSESSLDVYKSIQSDSADKTGTTDVTYTTSSTPPLRSGAINSISVTTGTSLADGTSNTIALGTDSGAEVIQEHSTQASGYVEHHLRTGTVGSSNWSSKTFGGALSFNGTSQYVAVGAITGGTAVKTVEMWIYPTSTTGQIIDLNGSAYISASSGTVSATGFTSPTIYVNGVATSTIVANQWQHLAVVTGTGLNASATNIGKRSTLYFTGYIDEVRLSTTARYSAGFSSSITEFASDANTAALWHFDERAGQYVFDDSGNDNNGTLGANSSASTDDPLRITADYAGSVDKVNAVSLIKQNDTGENLSFNGSNYVSASSSTSLDVTQFTASLWWKPSAIASWAGPMQDRFASKNGFMMVNDTSSTSVYTPHLVIWNGTSETAQFKASSYTLSIPSSTYHHCVWTYDGTTARFFVDGVEQTVSTSSVTAYNVTGALIGKSYAGVTGNIDDARVYNRALGAGETYALYNGGMGSSTNSSTGLVGWWPFTEGTGATTADTSGSGNTGTLTNVSGLPTWATGSPVKHQGALWIGTTSAGSNTGALTAASYESNRAITNYTASNSGLPNNDINSLSYGGGGLALVGTASGAWSPGLTGFPVDDTSSTPSTVTNPVRVKAGTVRIKGGGTVRVKPISN